MENIDIDLQQVDIANVDSVLTGPEGPAGFSPVATVTKVDNVTTITITDEDGTTTAQVLDGTNGQNGQNNTLTIGTVTTGVNPSATITGDSPNQVLNLVLPKGDTGATGQAGTDGTTPTVTVGTTTTLPAGSPATVTQGGTATNVILNFGIPRGSNSNALSVPTIVDELPETGDPNTFYFVPRTYTSTTASGDSLSLNITDNTGGISSFVLEGYTTQSSVPGSVNNLTGNVDVTFGSNTITIPLGSLELCNIGSHKDYIHKVDGVWKIHRELGKTDLSTLTWTATTSSIRGSTSLTDIKYVSSNTIVGDGKAVNYGVRQGQGLGSNVGWLAIDVTKVNVNTGGSTNPTGNFYYQLATATETNIQDEDLLASLNEIESLSFEQGTVTVTTSANVTANISIGYYSYDIHNQYQKYVYMPRRIHLHLIGISDTVILKIDIIEAMRYILKTICLMIII